MCIRDRAVTSPLLETTIEGASHVIINISGDIGLMEANDAASYVQELAGDNANIIFGAMYDETKQDEATITVIATGLDIYSSTVSGSGKSSFPFGGGFSSNSVNHAKTSVNSGSSQTGAAVTAPKPSPSVEQKEIKIPEFLQRTKY